MLTCKVLINNNNDLVAEDVTETAQFDYLVYMIHAFAMEYNYLSKVVHFLEEQGK